MAGIFHHCQYNVGLGHLARTRAILEQLAARHEVTVALGGDPAPEFGLPEGTTAVQLEPIMRRDDGCLGGRDGRGDLAVVRARRRAQLFEALDAARPDCLVIEMFPFNKRDFRDEILALVQAARELQPRLRVVCSLRDLFRVRPDESPSTTWIKDTLADLEAHFDLVLYHADRSLVRLEECFPAADRISCDWVYTGLVAPRPVPATDRSSATPRIVGSAGGGAQGLPLLSALIEASRRLDRPHELDVFCGPFMAADAQQRLHALAAGASHVRVQPLAPCLAAELSAADLSVSLCGYNTALDILRARVPALVMPSPSRQFREQQARAQRLAARGIVAVLDDEDLAIGRMTDRLREALDARPVAHHLDLDGAARSAAAIDALLETTGIVPPTRVVTARGGA